MKKINFSDKYGLTEAVLSGRKTQTRRVITCPKMFKGEDVRGFCVHIRQSDGAILEYPKMCDADEREIENGYIMPKYQVGEVIAVAQPYIKIASATTTWLTDKWEPKPEFEAGWNNKMFVCADLMPHRIRITNVRVERLQEISDEDCIKEGVIEVCVNNNWGNCASHWEYNVPYEDDLGRAKLLRGLTPQETYAALIDRIAGRGVWSNNPFVFVYDFELIK